VGKLNEGTSGKPWPVCLPLLGADADPVRRLLHLAWVPLADVPYTLNLQVLPADQTRSGSKPASSTAASHSIFITENQPCAGDFAIPRLEQGTKAGVGDVAPDQLPTQRR